MNNVSQLSANGERKERRRLQLREVAQGQTQEDAAADTPLEVENVSLGAALRAARLERGEDAPAVAAALKMRLDQLEAIENDNFAKLPGRTYALGFVRAYAQHLGVDVEDVVQRYKDESKTNADAPKAVQHVFPQALEEQRLPNGSILVVALVIAMVIYGISYLTVPSRKNPATAKADEQSVTVVQPKAATEGAATEAPPAAESGAVAIVPAIPPADVPLQSQTVGTAIVPAAPPQLVTTMPADATDTFVAGNARMPMPPLPATSIQVPEDPQSLTQLASAVIVPAGNDAFLGQKNAAAPGSLAQVQTPSENLNAGSRVTFTALQATYIRIRDLRQPGATALLDRVLNPGESFQPPDRAGLVMQTGNAGGLQVEVDGRTIGVLGKSGEVITRIPVDASYFLERVARQQ